MFLHGSSVFLHGSSLHLVFVTADLSDTKAIVDDNNNNISLCVWTKFRLLGVKMKKIIKEREDKGTVRKSKKGGEKDILNSSLLSISIKLQWQTVASA